MEEIIREAFPFDFEGINTIFQTFITKIYL